MAKQDCNQTPPRPTDEGWALPADSELFGYRVHPCGYVMNASTRYVLKPYELRGGLRLTLYNDIGVPFHRKLSRIVYETFVGELDTDDIVAFKDGDITNVCVDNLKVVQRGTWMRQTDDADILAAYDMMKAGHTYADIARALDIGYATVRYNLTNTRADGRTNGEKLADARAAAQMEEGF